MRNTNWKMIVCLLLAVLLSGGLLSGCRQTSSEEVKTVKTPETAAAEPTSTPAPTAEITEPTEAPTEAPKSETWFRTYGGGESDVLDAVLPAEDGGYYLLGATNFVWESEEKADIYLIRVDKFGEMVWDKTLTNGTFALGQSLTFTSSGTIMIAGVTRGDEANGVDMILVEVDLDGNLLGSNVIGGEMDDWVNTIFETEDGGLILFGNIVDPDDFVTDPGAAGYGGFENRSSIHVVRLDQNGQKLWSQTFDSGENVVSGGAALAPDGGYYIIASILQYPEMGDDALLMKLDKEGNEIWSRTWEDGRIIPRGGQVTDEGNLLIGAIYSESGDPRQGDADYLIMELDEQGNEIWRTIFGTPDEVDALCGIIETEDGGYLLVGDRSADLYGSDSEMVLIKLDGQREVVWEKVLDRQPHFMIRTLAPTKGGYIIAASFFSRHSAPADILLIKTDLNGDFAN